MSIWEVIVNIILMIVDLGLIVLVLAQQGKTAGLSGAIAGGAETFFGKQKARGYEGKLKFFTKILAVAFIVLSLVMILLQRLSF